MRYFLSAVFLLFFAVNVQAQLHTEMLEYRHEDTVLEGYLAYDDSVQGKRPGILVVHEWTGLGSYVKRRAEQLAELGYIAFALDMYGKGIRPKTSEEAAAQAKIYRSDRGLMRNRARAGLRVLIDHRLTDQDRVAVIGYCFGGGAALELARSGAPLAGVVSFHGNLDTPDPKDAKNIKGRVLVLHGAEDRFVPADQVRAFHDEMRDAGVDWQMVTYGGAVHAFTNPDSGQDKSRGVAYDERADRRSWQAMKLFFAEIFE